MMPLADLSELCLDKIAGNFERYYLAYTPTEDEKKKEMLEFLKRKYSSDLLDRLLESNYLPEKYVDVFINKYLNVFKAEWLHFCSATKIISKMADIGCNVQEIIFQDWFKERTCEEKAAWKHLLSRSPDLKIFRYKNSHTDLILKWVAEFCPNIEEIHFEKSRITSQSAKYLCKNENGKALCTKLKKIFSSSTRLNYDDVKYLLRNLPSLEVLDYPQLPLVLHSLHQNDLPSLDKVEPYNLTTLDLMKCGQAPFFVDILKVCLSVCPHLKSFTCGLENRDELNFFSHLSDLEKLHIVNFSDLAININNLLKSKGGKLTSLTVSKCTVSFSNLAKSCPRVKELNMNNVDFVFDEDLEYEFSSLFSCTFEDVNIIPLLFSSKMGSLSFIKCRLLSPEIKTHILKCCELCPIKEISFCDSVIEKEFVKDVLLNCRTLNCLNIKHCFSSDDEEELLKFAGILPNKLVLFSHLLSDSKECLNGMYESDDEDFYDSDYDYDSDYAYYLSDSYDEDGDYNF